MTNPIHHPPLQSFHSSSYSHLNDRDQQDRVKRSWNEISRQTAELINAERLTRSAWAGQIYMMDRSASGEEGFVTSFGTTNIQHQGVRLFANQVGRNYSTYPIIASSAPTTIEMGESMVGRLRDTKAFILDLRHPEDLARIPQSAYKPILRESTTVSPRLPESEPFRVTLEDREINDPAILRYAFSAWPDAGTIPVADLDKLVLFVDQVFEKRRQAHPSAELWVHCQGGVGRTGTFLTAFLLRKQILENPPGNDPHEWLANKLQEMVLSMRKDRSSWFVQKPAQFKLLNDYGCHLLGIRVAPSRIISPGSSSDSD